MVKKDCKKYDWQFKTFSNNNNAVKKTSAKDYLHMFLKTIF